jgi:nucleotide-binding universal stress UspA family protein
MAFARSFQLEVLMKKISKILIAYDGSACAKAALDDLKRCGLTAPVEAVVVTVADVIAPPVQDEVRDDEPFPTGISWMVRPSQVRAEEAVRQAQTIAEQAANRVKADFPPWEVKVEARGDSPAWAVIKLADRLRSDLIVIGSHRHASAGGRLILGSVSQRVLYEARCSVRVARCSKERGEEPVRIVVGFNGSQDSEIAMTAVALRAWPEGSQVHVITARDALMPAIQTDPAERLRAAGLEVSSIKRDGDPAHVLINEAEQWDADSIFVGTKGVHGMKHILQGSVSSAVAASAPCSVEVARPGPHFD